MSIQLFALHSSQDWGNKIVAHLGIFGISQLAQHEEMQFEDGEHKAYALESVRGNDVFLVQSLYTDNEYSVNDKIARLLFFIGALKDASAKQITVVIPYFAYARKDRKTQSQDSVTMRYMAQLLEAMGADKILTMDIHNLSAYQNAFRIPTDHLEARVLFAPYIASIIGDEEVTVVSPDPGGIKRAEQFRDMLASILQRDVGKAFLDKKRSDNEIIGGGDIIGQVNNRTAIIIDDMISSGKTIALAVESLHRHGARRIFACASHGLFIGGANELLADHRLEKIIITDSVPPYRIQDQQLLNKLTIIDATCLFAKAIVRAHRGESVDELMKNPVHVL